jgi:hypothetical protein
MIVDRRFRGAYCHHHQIPETSETSVDNHFTRQYNPEDNSEQNITILVIVNVISAKLKTGNNVGGCFWVPQPTSSSSFINKAVTPLVGSVWPHSSKTHLASKFSVVW